MGYEHLSDPLALSVFVLTLFFPVAVGLATMRRTKSQSDFLVGGRFGGCEGKRAVGFSNEDPVDRQRVEVHVQVQRATKALDDRDGPGTAASVTRCLGSLARREGSAPIVELGLAGARDRRDALCARSYDRRRSFERSAGANDKSGHSVGRSGAEN